MIDNNISIKFVIVAKDEHFNMPSSATEILKETYPNVSFSYVENNKEGLPSVYNKHIKEARTSKNLDYLAFLHADITLDLNHLIQHIIEVHGKYDAIGLCGCSKINATISPLNWYNGSRLNPEGRWGFVHHSQHNSDLFWNQHTPDATDHEVACIDGLFIMITKNIIENTDFEFDTKFLFDQYDTDFSFNMMIKYKKKLGVLVEKSLIHDSIGESILTTDFLKHEVDFRNKWGLKIPDELKHKLGIVDINF